MKKAKKNFNTNKATYMANKLDFTNKGFAPLASTDSKANGSSNNDI